MQGYSDAMLTQYRANFIPLEGGITLLAASALSAVLGSVHAFSVLLEPLENQFESSRAIVSLTYSFALMSLTVAVLFGSRIFTLTTPPRLVLITGAIGTSGVLLAGHASNLLTVWVGYSLMFGAANGLGYGFGLQIAAQANPKHTGMAMGVVTAAYAFGAITAPVIFTHALSLGGFRMAMYLLAAFVITVSIASASLLMRSRSMFQSAPKGQSSDTIPIRIYLLLWLGYFGAVCAGLMVIGHASGIAFSLQPHIKIWLAPALIAISNLVGSLIGGRLIDKFSTPAVLTFLPIVTVFSVLCLIAVPTFLGMLLGLGMIGFSYGATIAAYPAAIARMVGLENSTTVYGRIFTAWGSAGLFGPWLAGAIYDWTGGYMLSLIAVIATAFLSVLSVFQLKHTFNTKGTATWS